ncbi:SDR family oxidoreductase [Pedobacter sp. MW01-1-1]|uniref:SDR family oxidoreductase n=1 Tax=Pedobacter sp. MW01-1-1 TaxID=3383027 RepID=UPI003FEDB28B
MSDSNHKNSAKIISILGCGWFGKALAKKLIELNYQVKGSCTSQEKLEALYADKIEGFVCHFSGENALYEHDFFDCDVLFICIPPKRNSVELNHYPNKIKSIIEAAKNRAQQVVFISTTGVYGDENRVMNEQSACHPDTASGQMVLQAENVLRSEIPQAFTIIRFAGLIGPDRNPGRFFAGKTSIPNGLAPVNLIHQEDAVGIAVAIIQKNAFNRIYTACNPEHPSRQDFYTKAALASGFAEPDFIAEMKNWKQIESVHVSEFLNYQFQRKLI